MRAWLFVLSLLCAACSQEVRPATQVLIVVESDLQIGSALSSLRVSIQDEDGTDVGQPSLLMLATTGTPGQYALPLSFGVVKRNADSLRVVVTGYGPVGDAGKEIAIVEQKAQITFQNERTLRVVMFLGQACVANLCQGSSDQVCYPRSVGRREASSCGPIVEATTEIVLPGAELIGIDNEAHDASQRADGRVDTSDRDAGAAKGDAHVEPAKDPSSADASSADASSTDASSAPCAALPCGANAVCTPEGASYSCACVDEFVGAAPGGCRRPVRRLSSSDGACVIRDDGSVWCWAGLAMTGPRPTQVPGLNDAIDVVAGGSHGCARRVDNTVVCWGFNEDGQLGNGSNVDSPTPVPVTGLRDVRALEARIRHTCAVDGTGHVLCWGQNQGSSLGNRSNASNVPVTVAGVEDAVQLAVGFAHVCALTSKGRVWCWGDQTGGALGNGVDSPDDQPTPTMVASLDGIVEVTAGTEWTCARSGAGVLSCWGHAQFMSNGLDIKDIDSRTPFAVATPGELHGAAAGGKHYCALQGHVVVCRGANYTGQLGNGTFVSTPVASSPSSTFVPVTGIDNAREVSADLAQTCALLDDGRVMCWGEGMGEWLGTGNPNDASAIPVEVTFR